MHQHLHPHLVRLVRLARPRPVRPHRPAHVIDLDVRRKARLEAQQQDRQPPPLRPAA
jgi:hypothetical protein